MRSIFTVKEKYGVKMESSVLKRVDDDLEKRTVNGFYIYTLAWLLIGMGTGFSEVNPTSFWTIPGVFLILGALRLVCFVYSKKLRAKSRSIWFTFIGY